jgi:hypothetical protein
MVSHGHLVLYPQQLAHVAPNRRGELWASIGDGLWHSNLAIQPVKRACSQLLAVVEDTATASAQRVERSTIVKRCVWPHRVMGRGPTRSTSMCENLLPGPSIGWVAARACAVTFPRTILAIPAPGCNIFSHTLLHKSARN